MERYLIALDLDGTTLNTEGQLSAGTIAVLRAAQAAGHLVVITTGRPDAISEQF
ncbi:HAD family hydrolase, partial [Lacticaseibacillus rhamnosus]